MTDARITPASGDATATRAAAKRREPRKRREPPTSAQSAAAPVTAAELGRVLAAEEPLGSIWQ